MTRSPQKRMFRELVELSFFAKIPSFFKEKYFSLFPIDLTFIVKKRKNIKKNTTICFALCVLICRLLLLFS